MREYSTPSVPRQRDDSLTDALVRHADERPDAPLLARRTPDAPPEAPWDEVDAADLADEVRRAAAGLLAAGVEPGDRVALLSRTRWEWMVLDLAVWWVGGVSVPVFESAPERHVAAVVRAARPDVVVVERPEQATLVAAARPDDAREDGSVVAGWTPRHVWSIDGDGEADHGVLDLLGTLGAEVDPQALEERRTSVGPDDPATIVFGSGSRPRGVVLTHGHLATDAALVAHELGPDLLGPQAATLVILPLAHVPARVVQVACLQQGALVGHAAGTNRLWPAMRSFRPTFLLGVPRVFETLFNSASQRAAAAGRGRVFDRGAETAIAYSRSLDPLAPVGRRGARIGGRVGGTSVRARRRVMERMVYADLREEMGGRLAWGMSGGAPLGDRLGHFFRGIGIPVLEGYGLSETTGTITLNSPDAHKVGTVGRPLPGSAVRVADDGELLFRGPTVFEGYWGDPGATREVLRADGWLHSGDLGEVDDEGFVRVTGRTQEIIVTAGGKQVAPTALEDRLRAHPLVSQALVVGDGRPFVGALVTLDRDALAIWAEQHGLRGSPRDLAGHPDVVAAVQEAVDDVNAAVSQAESIRHVRVLPDDWSEERGQLTPSLKLRRNVVVRQFRDEIAALYL
ncbi:MAG: long-chain fatty acid--CoA ligase [Nocardioides sp.]|nr:long-chain fatty acid--CoA ligase [Nocardioides sp.]